MTTKTKLNNYIECTSNDAVSVIDFIKQNPDCLLDTESCSDFLYSDLNESLKLSILLQMLEIKEKEEANRPRLKGQKFNSYGEYLSIAKEKVLSKEDFGLLYHCIDKLPLSNSELECDLKSSKAIEELYAINESESSILRFIENYSSNPAKFKLENIKDLSKCNFDERMDYISAYSKACSCLDTTYRTIIDALCYTELKNPFDYVLENKAVFQRFAISFENSFSIRNPLLIIYPSYFFIRKWIKENPASNRKTYFCMPDDSFKDIIKPKMLNNDIFFISFDELKSFLNLNTNIPTNTLFFGNHFTDPVRKCELFKIITERISDTSSLQYYDFDREILNIKSSIFEQFRSRDSVDIDINRFYLFPSRTIGNNKFKRTILVEFKYGYIKEKYKPNADVFKYEIKTDYNVPYISSNVFHNSISKNPIFENEDSLRKIYHDEKQLSEKKTDKTKVASIPINLSDEITFMFSFNDNGPRKRTSCYFLHKGMEVDGTRQSPTAFKTREEALRWATNIYPFSLTRKGIPIQELANQTIVSELRNKRICLSTVIYIHHELFHSLPDKLQKEMKYIIHSYIGEFYIDQLSKEYLLDFLNKEYSGNQRGITLIAILSALARFYDRAIENGNASSNTASLLLQEIRRGSRNVELAEVRNALTLKNLYVDEIKTIFNSSVATLNKSPSISLATIIRLITGLEPNIICALLWKDFISFKSNEKEIYQLVIRRELNNEGDTFLYFEKKYQNRIIPFPDVLANILLKEKERQLNELGSDNIDYFNECTIINGNDHVINGQCRILSPIKLYEANRKLFLSKKLNGRIIEVPDNKGGTIETNIDYYQGDIFKSNLRHYCLAMNYGFSYDQTMYLLGNKASNTFYSNYFDFMNTMSQYHLYKKIEAMWEDLLK